MSPRNPTLIESDGANGDELEGGVAELLLRTVSGRVDVVAKREAPRGIVKPRIEGYRTAIRGRV